MNTIIINFEDLKDKITNYHTADKFVFDKFKMIVNFKNGEKIKAKVELKDGTRNGIVEVETSEIIYAFKFEQSGETHLKVYCLYEEIQQIAFNAAQLITFIMEYIMTTKREKVYKVKENTIKKYEDKTKPNRERKRKYFYLMKLLSM